MKRPLPFAPVLLIRSATITDALTRCANEFTSILAACERTDARIAADASAISEDYRLIACAAWRQVFAAHKLIATPKGEMALLSKENNSNGCIGTVDVSYPSIPMLLKYCPELVNALGSLTMDAAPVPVAGSDGNPVGSTGVADPVDAEDALLALLGQFGPYWLPSGLMFFGQSICINAG